MNGESKINVHHSSLLGLKSELLRKQAEVEALKASKKNVQFLTKNVKEKKPREKRKDDKKKRAQEETVEDIDSMKALKKSQLMLQAKSRLYSKLSKTRTNMNPNFLVDFERKTDYSDDSDEERYERDKDDYVRSDNDSDGEFVEYTDCFGRTRKCLPEDLPKMKDEDKRLRKTIEETPRENSKEQVKFFEDRQPQKEPTIEVMRRKWEEETAKLANKADIHYQDILFDEARTHGVGYYAFSQDEEMRIKQQESLAKLRKETEQRQKENQVTREIKDRIQQNRLKVARMRQRIRAGLPPDEPEEEKTDNTTVSNEEDNKKQETVTEDTNAQMLNEKQNEKEIAKAKEEDTENKIKAFGELLGKRNKWYVMSQEEWVQKKRKERVDEFAPVYGNFKKGETLDISEETKNNKHKKLKNSSNSEDEDSDVIGPLPPSQEENDEIGPVPPPEEDADVIGPMPPSLNEEYFIGPMPTTSSNSSKPVEEATSDTSVSIEDQITAGLKFLREQFEQKYKR